MTGALGPKPGADRTTASPARMYDYYLGGSHNYEVDRDAARKALSVVPHGQEAAVPTGAFLCVRLTTLPGMGLTSSLT